VVHAAGRHSSPHSDQALAELCQAYWFPLYAFIRRQGHSRENAEDLTQSFFARLLARQDFQRLDPSQGRFRAFLLACLKNHLANEHDRRSRQKRGGGMPHLTLDWQEADRRFQGTAAEPAAPDHQFDREWALALLERVLERLANECQSEGRADLFQHTRTFLSFHHDGIPYAQAAQALNLDEGAVRVAVHRLRKRYRDLLRDEIAQTLLDPAQADEELRSLRAALAAP
jgi:RNA polymerase sigma-70 factor (ECF subfamily)